VTVVVAEGLRLRSGRYELERRLGAGAHATVWLARDGLLERRVAVKVLAEGLVEDRTWLARFRREARIAAGLQHPNLVSIYDFDADVERPYLVMEYMPGGSLQDRLDAGGAPDPERLAVDLLRALEHIHAAGITHRDVKPGNVLLDRDGRAALTDFGVARPQDATSITQTGQIPGTARYMAPELWRGEPASARTDLFSTGVLLAQCLGDEAPAHLATLVERLSAESPDFRPASATEALALAEAQPTGALTLEHAAPEALDSTQPLPPDPPRAGPALRGRRSRWLPVAGLAVVAVLAGFAFANAIGGGEDEPADPVADAPRDETTEEPASGRQGGDEQQRTALANESPPPSEPVTDPVALNDQGFALIGQGRYDEAIPILQQAVDGLRGSGDITYAYALFNLGNALRLAGRPEEAIPVLEERLKIPNQTGTVQHELDLAREAAGVDDGSSPSGQAKPKKPKKPKD
jgi:serine/threonine protein kinase